MPSAALTNDLFEPDDEETLEVLLTTSSNDTRSRLEGMAGRFRDDFTGTVDASFWDLNCKSAQELGFRVSGVSAAALPSTAAASPPSFPAAFETDSGKKHIRATSSLLRITETRAVQLTLSALRSLNGGKDTGETHIQSLLGTRDLLKTVRDYHYQQRTLRLQAITECLRIEQDDDAPNKDAATSMLNDLDQRFALDGRKRGLFQQLLCVACAPCSPPTRKELLPTLDLRSETPENLQQAQLQYANSATEAQDVFVTDCFQASRLQTSRERVEAMEALLVLFYHRIDQGIHRIDYVLILLAFQSCGTFFTTEGNNKRLSYLAALVTAECMSLWMTNSSETDGATGVPLWIVRHPILVGVVEGDEHAAREMEAILMLLTKYASQVPARKNRGLAIRVPGAAVGGDGSTVVDAPEGIALFSFALLLCLVQLHLPAALQSQQRFDFGKHGMECAQIASDDCGVFDYLHTTMEALVKTPIRDSFSSTSNVPYDWQFSGDSSPLLEGPSEQEELNAANVVYSSIGLELLSSTIVAFKNTIRTGNSISTDNVTMLCSLAATVYGNHPLLCDAFWENLQEYTSEGSHQDGPLTSKQALCYLVDAAHACATSALNAVALATVGDGPALEEDILPLLVPLLQLMSSLCSSSGMVESVLKLLPKGIIRISLLCCAPTSSVKDVPSFTKNALQVVEAVQSLARVGRSSKSRDMLRASLEEEGSSIIDGPRVLYRIISSQQNTDIVASALRVMGYFVESTTGGHELWVAKAAKYFGPFGLGENGLQAILTGPSTSVALSGLHVLSGFVSNMATIAFSPSCKQNDVLDVLNVVTKGVTAGCMLLTTLVSSTPAQIQDVGGLSYLMAHGVLRCAALFLQEVRPIINMHASLGVKTAAQEARAFLIQTLSTATPVAQAIAYFAAAPVSLSLVVTVEDMLQSAEVLQIASDEYARESEPLDFGAWRSVTDASRESKPAIEIAKVRSDVQNLVANIHELGIDLQGFQARGWTDQATAAEPLLAASAALDLLRLWALSANDIVVEQYGVRSGITAPLSQAAVSDLQALSPCRLVFSQVVRPPVVEASSSLRQAWPAEMLSLFNVLMRYLAGTDDEDEMMPSLVAADVLSLALADAKQFSRELHFSVVDAVVRCGPELALILNQAITNAAVLAPASGQQRQDNMCVRKALASLRLLGICTELDDRVVASICKAESAPLDGIVGILSSTASSVLDGTSLAQLSADSFLISQLRLASASINVLLSVWRSSVTKNTSKSVTETVAAAKKDVVAKLLMLLKFAALGLSADHPDESRLSHVVAVLAAATRDALEILTVEMSRDLSETTDKTATSAVKELMKSSFASLSHAFSKISAAVTTANSWSGLDSMMQSLENFSVCDPRSLLCAFPATYRSQMESHETEENLCDIAAASRWISPLHQATEVPVDGLKRCNADFILLSKQLVLVKSWGRFAMMFSIAEQSTQETHGDAALLMTRTVMDDLGRIAKDIEEAQMQVSVNYLPLDVAMVSDVLVGLLVETMSVHARVASSSQSTSSAETASLVEMLRELHSTMEKLLSSTRLNRPSHHVVSLVFPSYLMRETSEIRQETVFMCCALQKRMLAAANLLITTLDQAAPSLADGNQLSGVALQFVEAACKGLELVGTLPKSEQSVSWTRLSGELLDTSVSLLTVLLSRERGPRSAITGNSQFHGSAASSMKRANVMQSLVLHVDVASKLAVGAASSDSSQAKPVLVADKNQVEIVQSILSFVRTVAEIGQKSDDILSLLSSSGLSQMIVNNPLFIAANQHWVASQRGGHGSEQQSPALRGYLPLDGKVPVQMPEGNSRTIVTGTFLSGRDDPVHVAWRTALQTLQAAISAYSQPRRAVDVGSRHFLDTAIAFLRMYYASLGACLKQCASLSSDSQRGLLPGTATAAQVSHTVLTFNALCETADILALVSSLCSGRNLQVFENTCSDVYHGMTQACHSVLDGLSEFLAAAGTAKEIFAAMKDYDAQLQESANREGFGFSEPQVDINPLLTAGIPNAKHEAIKHAHYASRCCALVTSEDYKGLPSETSGNSPLSTSTLEKNSQLSMNSAFMFRMEHAAAECVSLAVTVLSETHPASSCFVAFSPDEVRRRDMLSLLKEGMVISALPEEGSNDVSRYYRILYVDTVRRVCHVKSLGEEGDQMQITLAVERVNGMEDLTKRHPVLAFSAAPGTFAQLESAVAMADGTASLGDLIAVLRWCYQCACGSNDSDKRKLIRKDLAENASVLLSTEVSLHKAIGTFSIPSTDELTKRVTSQLLQLFDDSNKAPTWSGSLKHIIETSVWRAVQQQLEEELKMARDDRREKKLQSLKRAAAVNGGPSLWFNPSRQHTGVGAQQPNFGAAR